MQKLSVVGNIGRDAQIIAKNDGFTVNFSLAHSQKYINGDSEEIEKTDWYSVFKRFKKSPDKLIEHLKKGHRVYVSGEPSYSINQNNSQIECQVVINASNITLW